MARNCKKAAARLRRFNVDESCITMVTDHCNWWASKKRILANTPVTARELRKMKNQKSAKIKSLLYYHPILDVKSLDSPHSDMEIVPIELLGAGREAEVWRVCDASNGDLFALKVFRRAFKSDESDKAAQSKISNEQSFQDNIRFSYLDHPNILSPLINIQIQSLPNRNIDTQVHYSYKASLFELASSDLQDFVVNYNEDVGPVPESLIACITHNVARSMSVLINEGSLWMDCKPRNIMMFGEKPAISDLGFLKAVGSETNAPGSGTPGYRPPEYMQASGKVQVQPPGMTFSLGATMYFMTYNKHAFTDEDVKAFSSDTPVPFGNRTTSRILREVLSGMLDNNPEDRLSIEEVVSHPFFNRRCPKCTEVQPDQCCCDESFFS